MDNFVDERDFILLEQDKYTFCVLKKILAGECHVVLSDHERLIICHTEDPFPVWVWTPDDASEEELEKDFEIVNEVLPVSEGYIYDLKYNLAEKFIEKTAGTSRPVAIKTNMLAYDCPELILPHHDADGEFYKCTLDDVDTLVEFTDWFHHETGVDEQSLEEYRKKVVEGVKDGIYFLWKNAEGRFVASCNYRPSEDFATVGLVYTKPDDRRKHYAENLVYGVTKVVKEAGYEAMLYTDADYIASNSCYTKIGYVLRGKLCMIG